MYQFERRERLSRAQSLVGAASFSSSTVQSYGLPFPWDTFDLGGGGRGGLNAFQCLSDKGKKHSHEHGIFSCPVFGLFRQ